MKAQQLIEDNEPEPDLYPADVLPVLSLNKIRKAYEPTITSTIIELNQNYGTGRVTAIDYAKSTYTVSQYSAAVGSIYKQTMPFKLSIEHEGMRRYYLKISAAGYYRLIAIGSKFISGN